ncbi:MAG: DNA polymerase I [Candidatus Omnitrophica bacterium]|nr:DNA polymerase I [Candidatus Omnitrophota bacterium]MDD5690169.1 DNA polymerase I [Candidatus Omnitrophota bacterium]
MADKKLFLIDATAFCYRAFYALSGLATASGQPTNAVYGFLNILNKILKEHKPDYLACCFDVSRDTFRLQKFAQYKMQRPAMPDGLSSQIPIIKEIISAYGISIFEKKGFEADDIIAELARKGAAKKLHVTIVSSDKDILQLVDSRISVFNPYKGDGVLYDTEKVKDIFGVSPKMTADIIALMGDDADNIPGVPGIGEKTAEKLILEFGSLEKLLKNIAKVNTEKTRTAISGHIERIRLNKELIVLNEKVGMELVLKKVKIGAPDYRELGRIFRKLEFKSLLKDLPDAQDDAPEIKLYNFNPGELKGLLKQEGDLTLYGDKAEDLFFSVENKIFSAKSAGKYLDEAISDSRIKKTGYDLKKLKVSLFKQGLILDGLDFDVMIAAYLLNPSRSSYALVDLALENLGEFIRQEGLETKNALALVVKLKPVLKAALEEKGLLQLFVELEMPLVSVLAQMEQEGIKLDLELLKELSRDIEKRLIKLIAGIYEASGTQFNINSPKQLGQVLFEKLALPIVKKTKTGPSTDEEVLRRLTDKHALPALLLEYRQLTKLKNTYVDALPKLIDPETARVHTSFNQTATETGRLSSSNPNLQNIPIKTDIGSKIRKAIIASGKDNCLLSCDYSQIELRVLAHLCGDETLVEAFHNNQDVHRLTASLIYNVSEQEVVDDMREVAKRVNFGIIYGQSAYGLSKDLGIFVNQAQDFIDAYFLRYPKVKDFIDAQINKARTEGFVTTLMGRRRYIPEINSKNMGIRQFAERQAVNTPIQGTASDLIKLAMVKISEQIRNKGLKSKMILQIHDELVFDLPVDEIDTLTMLVKERMEQVRKLDVPIRIDMKKGKNWLDMEVIE